MKISRLLSVLNTYVPTYFLTTICTLSQIKLIFVQSKKHQVWKVKRWKWKIGLSDRWKIGSKDGVRKKKWYVRRSILTTMFWECGGSVSFSVFFSILSDSYDVTPCKDCILNLSWKLPKYIVCLFVCFNGRFPFRIEGGKRRVSIRVQL